MKIHDLTKKHNCQDWTCLDSLDCHLAEQHLERQRNEYKKYKGQIPKT